VAIKVGINGFGRIGRNFFRACSPAEQTSRWWVSMTSPIPRPWRTC
jgi:glyceraldehyde-3-phosphate dehydrogenase/erythrose-4-phosphate dehydrogenase